VRKISSAKLNVLSSNSSLSAADEDDTAKRSSQCKEVIFETGLHVFLGRLQFEFSSLRNGGKSKASSTFMRILY